MNDMLLDRRTLRDLEDHAWERAITTVGSPPTWSNAELAAVHVASEGLSDEFEMTAVYISSEAADQPPLKTEEAAKVYAHARAHNMVKG